MAEEHYFTADPSVPFERMPVPVAAWGQSFELASGSGVFAKGRLDIGTSVLLRSVGPPGPGRYLDLGCGYGVIGLAIALAQPGAVVDAVDVNERAVLLANENAATLGVAPRYRATTAVSPGSTSGPTSGSTSGPTPATYDEIWSNPPIRIGKEALHALLLAWLPALADDGRAVLVVGKNLGADSLADWLTVHGYPTTKLASAKGFRVLESRPGPTRG